MEWYEIGFGVLVCLILAYIGRIGIKMYLFLLIGVLSFGTAIGGPLVYAEGISKVFHNLVHPQMALTLVSVCMAIVPLVFGLRVSKAVEGIFEELSEQGDVSIGVLFGLSMGLAFVALLIKLSGKGIL